MSAVARRVSVRRMLRFSKAWLETPVEENDGAGGERRTNRAPENGNGLRKGHHIPRIYQNVPVTVVPGKVPINVC